jgi:hypothetical protein
MATTIRAPIYTRGDVSFAKFIFFSKFSLPNCWRLIFLVLPKLNGCQVGLSKYWSYSTSQAVLVCMWKESGEKQVTTAQPSNAWIKTRNDSRTPGVVSAHPHAEAELVRKAIAGKSVSALPTQTLHIESISRRLYHKKYNLQCRFFTMESI